MSDWRTNLREEGRHDQQTTVQIAGWKTGGFIDLQGRGLDGKVVVLQVLGTPTSGRHNADGDRQAAARLAGQHYLASPPDLHSRRGQRSQDNGDDDSDYQPSQATQGYSDALADNELDSEISSLFGGGEGREARLGNLHLMSPLEYAAMLKQYTEPSGLLGQDITPDSGVVVDSRHHSKVSGKYQLFSQSIEIDSIYDN